MRPIKAPAPLAQMNGGGSSQVGRLQDNSISLCFPVTTLKHSQRLIYRPVNTQQMCVRALGTVGVMRDFFTEAG